MANYEIASIKTDNQEVFDILVEQYQDDYFDMEVSETDDKTMWLRNRQGVTLQELQELTKVHTDALIHLTLAFESHRYEREYSLEVLNGDYAVISMTEDN